MQRILNYKVFAFAALLVWLLASWSGAHGHLCFDGQEPPVSVHIHAPDMHADHDSDQNHVDANVDIGQLAPAKSLKVDSPFVLIAAYLFAWLFSKPAQIFVHYFRFTPSQQFGLRPPLRAPPVNPA